MHERCKKLHDTRPTCIFILLFLTIAVSIVCVFQQDLQLPLPFLVVSAIVGAVLAGMQLGRERISLAGVHLFGVWLMLGFAPLLDYRSGMFDQHYASYHFFPFVPSVDELTLASVAVVFWLLSFKIGYWIRFNSAVNWIKNHNPGLGFFAVMAQCIVGIAALVYIYEKVGFGILTRRGFESFEYDTPGELTFFTSTIRSIPLIALLALTLMLRDGNLLGAKKIIAVVLGAGILIGNIFINNPLAAPRFLTGTIFLAFAFVLFFHRSRSGVTFLVLGLITVLVLFPIADVGRATVDLNDVIDDVPTFLSSLLAGDPYRTFEVIPAALRYLDQYGSTYGLQLLGPLLFWVPRSLWPDKPEGSGTMLAGALGATHDNISCPVPCEALLNFGWPGIPVIGILFAVVLRMMDAVSRLGVSSEPQAERIRLMDLIFPLLLGQTFFITRGDFLSPWAFTVGMIIATVPMLMAEALSRLAYRLRPRRNHQPSSP